MDEIAHDRRLPPWWLVIITVATFAIFVSAGGWSRAFWWIGLVAGPVAAAFVAGWIGKRFADESSGQAFAYTVGQVLMWIAGAVFVIGLLVTAVTLISPIYRAVTGSHGYADDGRQNWRR